MAKKTQKLETPPRATKASERLETISNLLNKSDRVDVNELARLFRVTIETVRRDLIKLENGGLIGRVHGGAVLRAPGFLKVQAPSASERSMLRVKEKVAIGLAALDYLPRSGVAILDAGTTVLELARRISVDYSPTFVSLGLPAALELSYRGFQSVLVPGGEVSPKTFASGGEWSLRIIEELSTDVVFVGVSGVSLDRGFTTSSHLDALMKQAILSAARQKIVLADSSKIGAVFTSKICNIDEIDVLITNADANPKIVSRLEKSGIEVVLAE